MVWLARLSWRAADAGSWVIEREQPGSQASRVAAGLLGTGALPLGEDEGLFPLKLDSLRRYPEFIAKVESIGRKSAAYRMDGTLWVARDAEERSQFGGTA